jgi:nucleotide-binding universal stress UspA family protein
MTALIVVLIVALLLLAAVALKLAPRRRPVSPPVLAPDGGARRILFPFVAHALSQRALDAALRLARADDATLVPVFLACVPLHLPLDTPLPRQSEIAMRLQEAVEQRASAFEIPVDARVQRGRTARHALRQTIADERFDRIVIAAATDGARGFGPDDVAWLLEHAPGEIVVLRPGEEERLVPPPPRRRIAPGARRRGAHDFQARRGRAVNF